MAIIRQLAMRRNPETRGIFRAASPKLTAMMSTPIPAMRASFGASVRVSWLKSVVNISGTPS